MKKVACSFDPQIAKQLGVNAAIILENIEIWQTKNQANNFNNRQDRHWVTNSAKAWSTLFDFFTPRQIQFALKKLVENEIIKKEIFNADKMDRTNWYSSNRIKPIKQNCLMQLTLLSDTSDKSVLMDETKLSNAKDKTVKSLNSNTRSIDKTQDIKPSNATQEQQSCSHKEQQSCSCDDINLSLIHI